jgi:hypothetical protein
VAWLAELPFGVGRSISDTEVMMRPIADNDSDNANAPIDIWQMAGIQRTIQN